MKIIIKKEDDNMNTEYIKALDVAKEFGLFLKVVTATSTFENYNSFFNIYEEYEEACRRIVVLTPFGNLEEVVEENSSKKINEFTIVDGNMWLKEYPLTINPNSIDLNNILIPIEIIEKIKEMRTK